jgi:hypothetical protein
MRGTDPLQHKTSGMAALASSLENQAPQNWRIPCLPTESRRGRTKFKTTIGSTVFF